jgi:hypothetical protein
MKVIGRDENALTELRKKLEDRPLPTRTPRKVRAPSPDDFSDDDDFFTSPPKKEKKEKSVPKVKSGLNCNDMYFLYHRLWREFNFTGNCVPWTLKERSHIKHMIAEQGDEAVSTYIKYCLRNWKELCHRYKIMSICPTVFILYGYRRSLLPEALDPSKKQTTIGAEYTETDIPSGSWG